MNSTSRLMGRRIAILVQNLPVPFDRRVWQEAKALRNAGADVSVICPSDKAHPVGEFDLEDISVFRYKAPREANGIFGYLNEYLVSLSRMRQMLKVAREGGRFDVIHFCNPPDLLYSVAAPYSRSDGSTMIFDQHDLGPELVRAKHLPFQWFFVAAASYFEKRTYRIANHVIATNESYKGIAVSRGQLSSEQVTVVRSGPNRDWASTVVPEDWHRGRKFLIGYVGVMGRQEGIEYLLEAMKVLIHEQEFDIHLALVGSGPDRDRLEALARAYNLEDRVEFHGRLPDNELKSVLADSDVCVNPDEVNEMNNLSTMNKIVEYMALGRPIVQFDVKEGRYSAKGASLYAEANNASSFAAAIGQVLTEPELAHKMASFGQERFKSELCWEFQSTRLVEAYEQAMLTKNQAKSSNK